LTDTLAANEKMRSF